MTVTFLGLLFCDESLKDAYKYSKAGVQTAVHTFQKTLIDGLCTTADVDVINVPPVGSYPFNYKKLFVKQRSWQKGIEIGYLNLPIIKHKLQVKKIYTTLTKKLRKNDMNYLLVYSLYLPFLEVVQKIKADGYPLKVCLIQTDAVPGRNDMPKYMNEKAVKKGNKVVSLAKECDSFVILTKYIADPLEIGERPYTVIECICDDNQKINKIKDKSENICLYTGTLEENFNICEMVDAFKKIPNAQLWICGAGNSEKYIRDASEKYENIKFYGYVDRQRVSQLRDECDFLINPRRPTDNYTLYSFPSKTAEYLMSGKPVIMYKLQGIPDDYDAYINYISAKNPAEMREELENIFNSNYDDLKKVAQNGREYILNNKNQYIQASKILELMKNNKFI
jgi:glycosyltransferase involved in cell wall biosynthesis